MRTVPAAAWMIGMTWAMIASTAFAQEPKEKPAKEEPKKDAAPAPQAVQFKTADEVIIAADYYPPDAKIEKAPVAILVHMYPADRKSWKPLLPALHKAGFAVLAYDIRGTGSSTAPADKKLQEKYRKQDSVHFNAAWQDAAAAKAWLADRKECDTTRLVIVGASIGCSIALDYGRREPAVKAIVCLSPGTDYFSVDSIAHIKACGPRPILLLSPEAEYKAIEQLIEASSGQAKGERHPGGREFHGTGMLTAHYGPEVMRHIVEFVGAGVKKQDAKRVE